MSIGTPKRTLNNAVTCLKPSDTLLVRGGTYPEALIHTIPAGTSWSLPVTIKGYPGETAILRPPTGSVGVLRFVQPQQYIVIDSLILDGVNVTYDVVKVTLSGSDPSVHAHHIRVQNSELMNAPGQCVLTAGGHFNEFINNKALRGSEWVKRGPRG